MTQPDFINTKPTVVRLASNTANALGLAPNADIELHAAKIRGDWLQADYRNADGSIDRYLLPSATVVFVKQRITAAESGVDKPAPAVIPTGGVGSSRVSTSSTDAVR